MIRSILLASLVLFSLQLFSQSIVSGKVIDQSTGEAIIGAVVFSSSDTVVTDTNGEFSITQSGKVSVRALGFEIKSLDQFNQNMEIKLEPSTVALNEIIINAGVVEDKIKNTASAVSVVSKDMLQRDAPYSITSSLNRVPGVYMHSGTYSTNRITIRGIGSRSLFGTNKIKAYYGPIPLTDGSGNSTIEDIDQGLIHRIEVLKGPNSSTYGAGLAGVIRLHPFRPEPSSTSLTSSLTLGSFGRLRSQNQFSHSDDKQAISATYSKTISEGFRANSEYDRDQAGLIGDWTLSPKTNIQVITTYTHLKAFIPSALDEDDYNNEPEKAAFTWGAAEGYEEYDKFLGGIALNQELSNTWQLSSSVFFNFRDAYEPRPFNILEETTSSVGTRNIINGQFKQLSISGGFELFKDRYEWGEFENTAPMNGSAQGDPISDFIEDRFYYNVFAEASFDVNKKLKLITGLNLNSTNYDLEDLYDGDAIDQSGSYQFDAVLSPRAGLVYHLAPSHHLFANVSHGFSPPTLDETLLPDGQINANIKPEKGWNYEAGVRGNHQGLTYDVVVYYMKIQDLLVAQRTDSDEYYGVNAGLNNHFGIDTYLNYKVNFGTNYQMNLFASASWMKYRFAQFVNEGVNYDGNQLTGVPEVILNPGVEILSENGFYGNITGQYIGEVPITDANDIYSDAYFILRSKVGYSRDIGAFNFDVYAGVDNLSDEKYAGMLLINNTGFGGASPRYYYPGDPRNYFAGLRLTYYIKQP